MNTTVYFNEVFTGDNKQYWDESGYQICNTQANDFQYTFISCGC